MVVAGRIPRPRQVLYACVCVYAFMYVYVRACHNSLTWLMSLVIIDWRFPGVDDATFRSLIERWWWRKRLQATVLGQSMFVSHVHR
jgi:hypothetical protein